MQNGVPIQPNGVDGDIMIKHDLDGREGRLEVEIMHIEGHPCVTRREHTIQELSYSISRACRVSTFQKCEQLA